MHIDEVKNNQFYQFPKWLLTEPYIELSHRAMLMYMLLWDRRGLSEKNGWYDEDGKVYIYFTDEQLTEILKCSEPAIIKSKKELTEILKELTEKERMVISLYYYEEITLKEIGKVMDVSESRVSQIHSKAVLKMRAKLAKKFKNYNGII